VRGGEVPTIPRAPVASMQHFRRERRRGAPPTRRTAKQIEILPRDGRPRHRAAAGERGRDALIRDSEIGREA
jgi:hypothetical protein